MANHNAKHEQTRLENILDFCVDLSRRMVVSGANLERVSLAVDRICHAYGLHDVSLYLLSSYISLSARDETGKYATRQGSIPPSSIHLEQLKKLNRLSFAVAEQTPGAGRLKKMLSEATAVKGYPDWLVLLAQIAAMCCLCLIFGGRVPDLPPVAIVTVLMHYLMRILEKPGLDKVVINAVTMGLAAAAAILLGRIGIGRNTAVILITLSMLVIPGIPLVNAVRNLLCGNEMNGILQVAKVTVETMALAFGLYGAIWALGMQVETGAVVVATLTHPVLLVALSFLASVSFGLVFRIQPRDLWLAGLGGALTRIVLLTLTPLTSYRLLYVGLSALFAALYGEVLASRRKDPSTYFVYPSIVPLIPGDLFYYTLVGLYFEDRAMMEGSAFQCFQALLGMSIGFVMSYVIAHYIRKGRHLRLVRGIHPSEVSSDSN